jgi:MoxR-like ATPase
VQAIQQIWQKHRETFKEDRREQLSDRRLKKVIKLVSVAAATNGRTEVNFSDVVLLKDCLWNHPDNAMKVRDMIMGVLQGFSYPIVSTSDDSNGDITAFLQGHSISAQEDDTYSDFGVIPLKATHSKSVIKGYKGSGTQTDPILISNYQEIASLERTDVGLKGYYFRQTADIDCSVLSTWPEIVFQGHYDGGGYSVIYKAQPQQIRSTIHQQQQTQVKHLFSNIKQHSSVIHLRLKTMLLAINADGSDISACTVVDCSLLDSANNCRITACESSEHLIVQNAKQCEITRCQSGMALIGDTATACTIANCFSILVSTSFISS